MDKPYPFDTCPIGWDWSATDTTSRVEYVVLVRATAVTGELDGDLGPALRMVARSGALTLERVDVRDDGGGIAETETCPVTNPTGAWDADSNRRPRARTAVRHPTSCRERAAVDAYRA
jgi:hypothetical protein